MCLHVMRNINGICLVYEGEESGWSEKLCHR